MLWHIWRLFSDSKWNCEYILCQRSTKYWILSLFCLIFLQLSCSFVSFLYPLLLFFYPPSSSIRSDLCPPPLVDPVVPWDGASPRGNQGDHPGGEPWSAVQRHPDGRQTGQGALRARWGGVRERGEVRHGTEYTPVPTCTWKTFFDCENFTGLYAHKARKHRWMHLQTHAGSNCLSQSHTKGSSDQLLSHPDQSNDKKNVNQKTSFLVCRCAHSWKKIVTSGYLFFLSVNSICCSPPLLPTYALPFIFLIPPSWHLLLCGVLHGWGIEFMQIKQPLRSAVSWEMKHVEIEGISIQILHTHDLFYALSLTSPHQFKQDVFFRFPPSSLCGFFILSVATPDTQTEIYCVRYLGL